MKVIFEEHDVEFNLDTLRKLIEDCKNLESSEQDPIQRAHDIHAEIEDCFNWFNLAMHCSDERAFDPVFGNNGTIEIDQMFYALLDFSNIEVLEESYEGMILGIIEFYDYKKPFDDSKVYFRESHSGAELDE